jgi:hypothetical protein
MVLGDYICMNKTLLWGRNLQNMCIFNVGA